MEIRIEFRPRTLPEAKAAHDLIAALQPLVVAHGGYLTATTHEHTVARVDDFSWTDRGLVVAVNGALALKGEAIPKIREVIET